MGEPTWVQRYMGEPDWIKRYDVPGWAVVHVDSKGFFGVVSDYGNYAYHWINWGQKSFVDFLEQLKPDYLCKKLSEREYDPEGTLQAVKDSIIECCQNGTFTSTEGEAEFRLLRAFNDLYSEADYYLWTQETNLDLGVFPDHFQKRPNSDCMAFCQKLYPEFIKLLRVDFPKEPSG